MLSYREKLDPGHSKPKITGTSYTPPDLLIGQRFHTRRGELRRPEVTVCG